MERRKWYRPIGVLSLLWTVVPSAVHSQQVKSADFTKRVAEAPAEAVAATPVRPEDIRKMKAELPLKSVVANGHTRPQGENPKVTPGKVRWHPNFESACQAAQKSGKPVLLFHLMGQLDEQFC